MDFEMVQPLVGPSSITILIAVGIVCLFLSFSLNIYEIFSTFSNVQHKKTRLVTKLFSECEMRKTEILNKPKSFAEFMGKKLIFID